MNNTNTYSTDIIEKLAEKIKQAPKEIYVDFVFRIQSLTAIKSSDEYNKSKYGREMIRMHKRILDEYKESLKILGAACSRLNETELNIWLDYYGWSYGVERIVYEYELDDIVVNEILHGDDTNNRYLDGVRMLYDDKTTKVPIIVEAQYRAVAEKLVGIIARIAKGIPADNLDYIRKHFGTVDTYNMLYGYLYADKEFVAVESECQQIAERMITSPIPTIEMITKAGLHIDMVIDVGLDNMWEQMMIDDA